MTSPTIFVQLVTLSLAPSKARESNWILCWSRWKVIGVCMHACHWNHMRILDKILLAGAISTEISKGGI